MAEVITGQEGSATERNGAGAPRNPAGVYVHPETGRRLIATRHPKFGDSQADAFVRVGFRFEREATADDFAKTAANHNLTGGQVQEAAQTTPADTLQDQGESQEEPTRKELNAQASELGVENPEKMKNKDEVKAAIEAAKSQEGNE